MIWLLWEHAFSLARLDTDRWRSGAMNYRVVTNCILERAGREEHTPAVVDIFILCSFFAELEAGKRFTAD